MMESAASIPRASLEPPPFLYEIRVKGRLSAEQWADWFEDLEVTSGDGESILRGRAEDHSALYGLLGRLRDLAIPLVGVKVLDAEAQKALARQGRQLDLLMTGVLLALYLVLLGGLVTVTIFVAPVINTALALTLMFASLGGLSYAFSVWSAYRAWRWLASFLFFATAVTFLIYIPVSGLLPPALGIGVMLFLLAAGLVYLLAFLRRWRAELRSRLTNDVHGSDLD